MATETLTNDPAKVTTPYVTAEEYLVRERAATDSKSEWIDGEIRPTTGARRAHNVLCSNLIILLGIQLRGRAFDIYPGEMKVRIPGSSYYYPDVCVAPDPPDYEDDVTDIITNPLLIVEVLSPSTEHDDRSRKLDDYRTLPSLQQYLLVNQFEARIDHYRRDGDGWLLMTATGLDATVPCPAIDCELPLKDVYDRILAAEKA